MLVQLYSCSRFAPQAEHGHRRTHRILTLAWSGFLKTSSTKGSLERRNTLRYLAIHLSLGCTLIA